MRFSLAVGMATLALAACNGGSTHDAGMSDTSMGTDVATDVASPFRVCQTFVAHDAGGMDAQPIDVATLDAALDASTDAPDGANGPDASDAGPVPVQLALGDQFTCALISDGTVSCWGANQDGEMADGTTLSHPSPIAIAGVSGATDLVAGGRHVCVRSSRTGVTCWGRDLEGQLGDGVAHFMPRAPQTIGCLTDITQLALGAAHSCARTMLGAVGCWGSNAFGQIGDGTLSDRATPTGITSLSATGSIALGDSHTCALLNDGTVRCWGDDTFGQLGVGYAMMSVATPTAVPGLATVQSITLGGFHGCALKRNGTMVCWGHNNAGQLGDGTMSDQSLPVEVPPFGTVVQLALGSAHTCARLMDGTVWCWGWNQSGQLGDAVSAVRATPAMVAGVTGAIDLAAGGQHTCALLATHQVLCWGNNERGQIGDGTHTIRTAPTMVPLQ